MAALRHRSAPGLASERGAILVQVGSRDDRADRVSRVRGRLRPDVGGAAPGPERGRRWRARRRHRARIRRLRRSQRTGPAKQSAHNVAITNRVAGEAPEVDSTTDVYFYDDDPDNFPTNASTTPAFAWTSTATTKGTTRFRYGSVSSLAWSIRVFVRRRSPARRSATRRTV